MVPWCKLNTGHSRTDNWKTFGFPTKLWIWLLVVGQTRKQIHICVDFPNGSMMQTYYRSLKELTIENIGNLNKNMNLTFCCWANEKPDSYLCWLSQWFQDAILTPVTQELTSKNIGNLSKNMNLTSCCWANEKTYSYVCWLSQWFHDAHLIPVTQELTIEKHWEPQKSESDFLLLGTRENIFICLLTFPMVPWCKLNTGHSRTDNWNTLGTSTSNVNLTSCCWADETQIHSFADFPNGFMMQT